MDGSSVFVFDNDGSLLLVKRRDVPIWVIPGGGIEQGETPDSAAIRETKEETGFDVKIIRKVAEYTYKNKPQKNYIFEAVVIGGIATLSNESKEVDFFETKNLPDLCHPQLSDWLEDLNQHSKDVIKREISTISIKQALRQIHKHPLIVLRFLLIKIGIHINT